MLRLPCLLLSVVMFSSRLGVQIHAQAAPDTGLYAVSYVEVMPSGRAATIAALRQYRDTSRHEDGYVRVELLEQVGRLGHFAIIETWKDQKVFEAHGMAAHVKQLRGALQSIRVSDYDQRLYKTLTVASATAAGNSQAVHVVAHVDTVGGAQADAPGLLKRLAAASRKEAVCGSTFCSTRCARITSQSSRCGRIRTRSTRTLPPRTRNSTATSCSRCPVALSMNAYTKPLNSPSPGSSWDDLRAV